MKPIRIFLIVAIGLWMSCSSDENPQPINQEELITTVIVTLTPTVGPVVTLRSQDLDGDGPNPPVITTSGNLGISESYQGNIEFLNETESPAEDVTSEIRNEDEDHQVFYQVGGNAEMTISYSDQDSNGDPVGLAFNISTGLTSNGTLVVTLRHNPDKGATGVTSGDILNAGGETDVSQSFSISIQ